MSWRVFGLPESQIGEMLENLLINTPYQSGYRLETPYVEVKIRFPKGETETVKSLIEPVLAPYIISPPHQSASAQLRSYLDEKPQHAISIIDQVSGGILQSLIQTPKNHQWVHFSNGNGTEEFAATFIIQGFKEYWHGNLSPTGTSLVNIEYQNANLIGNEEHSIPCRSTMPRHFAAEWLSFRLFHLLNQLH